MNDINQHCFELVRAGDKDRFLACLFAPESKRAHLLALYAFNIEVARIAGHVSEPALGEIRHQWWLDTLDSIYSGEVPQHPVAQALARAVEAGDLPKHALQSLIKARSFELYADPMPSLTDLEGYLGETSSAMIQLAALILAGDEALVSAEAAGLAGVAFGLAGILRSLPLHRARGQCYLPLAMLQQRDATPADVIAGANETAVGIVLADLREQIRLRLMQAREKAWTIQDNALPAFLHVTLTQLFLAKLDAVGSHVLRQGAEVAQWRKQWLLWKSAKAEGF